MLNPLKYPICLARPLRVADSFWVQHIPFGMFLIDFLRPTTIVELGTFTGVSYCAFCQAVKELKLDSRCYAVDTWQGDAHNGFYGPEVLADLRRHHDPLYGTFSLLIQSTFNEALDHFESGTIDLLHIDGYHTYGAVKNDFENWRLKMSERGVMLFHDINVRERDFCVWRLWEELKREYPAFEMAHGSGLGLLAVGARPSEPLQELLQFAEVDLLPLREFFYQLGRLLEKEQAEMMLSAQLAAQQSIAGSLATNLRDTGQTSVTLGTVPSVLEAILQKKYWGLRAKLKRRALQSVHQVARSGQPADSSQDVPAATKSDRLVASSVPGSDRIQLVQQKIAPLLLNVSRTTAQRINLLIPTVDLKYFFGGYITKLNLARKLAEAGFKVRVVIVDDCDYKPLLWRQQLQTYQGLENFFDHIELAYAFDRTKPLEVNEHDIFIATTWWTAHIAHRATKHLNKERFLYLIQEYEPFTFSMGTFAAVANQTYNFPHYAIFSTEFLRDYFRQNALGVFAQCREVGDHDSISFQNAITSVGQIKVADIAHRSPKKLLFYARPEAHAARNMFEMAVLALSQAFASGYFKGEWKFYGIGTVETSAEIQLSDGVSMQLRPRQSPDVYREVLQSHDLGLSLMYTPHPSLVPIEMASAGMLVVTNTYATKTKDKLTEISSNIIAVEPTMEAVKLGLKDAAAGIENYEDRVRGSQVRWSSSWDSSFDQKIMAQIEAFIEAARQ